MAIQTQCPLCKTRQSMRRKICTCGEDLDKAKRSKRVKYWVAYRLPGGMQKVECVGDSLDDAKDIDAERRSQKARGGLPYKSKITFDELAKWYFHLEKVKSLASYRQVCVGIRRFSSAHGKSQVNQLKAVDLENLQMKRKAEGLADSTIDDEIGMVRTMVIKAFDNDMVGGEPLKAFKRTTKLLKRNSNARDRVLSVDEYQRLYEAAAAHLKPIIATGYYTGMRRGEILGLTWDQVDMKNGFIHLGAEDTKDKESRDIPICEDLKRILQRLPRTLHYQNVFIYTRKLITRDEVIQRPVRDIQRAMHEACKEAGITWGKTKDGFIFHDLRHTFNTNMRKAGVEESTIMSITGHSTRQMFDRYNTIDEGDKRNGIEKLRYFLQSVNQNDNHGKNNDNLNT
jgi:integrase